MVIPQVIGDGYKNETEIVNREWKRQSQTSEIRDHKSELRGVASAGGLLPGVLRG